MNDPTEDQAAELFEERMANLVDQMNGSGIEGGAGLLPLSINDSQGLDFARDILNRQPLSGGFVRCINGNRPDLTIEWQALEAKGREHLFSTEQIQTATTRLRGFEPLPGG